MSIVHVDISNDTLGFRTAGGDKRAIPKNDGSLRFQVHGWNNSPIISKLTFRDFRLATTQPNGSFGKGAALSAASVSVTGAAPSAPINLPAPTFPRLVTFLVDVEFIDGYALTIDPVIDDRP